jgi:ribosomal protein S18 acetylase RimI-like enzyme
VKPYSGSRSELLPLFMEADDSRWAIATYIDLGEVLVAHTSGTILGYIQLTATGAEWEIRSIAVLAQERHKGIGTMLVRAAIVFAFGDGATRLSVATAAADIDNLRFYQRLGFRMERVERDAFTADRGYEYTEVNGIPLRDRLWLSTIDST